MCKGNRGCFLLLFFLPLSFAAGALHAQEQPIPGETQLLPQNSGPSLNSSGNASQTWNGLYEQGQNILRKQKEDLAALQTEIQALKNGSQELTNLCGELSRNNDVLKNYNSQIAERMQERDEDLASAYERIDVLEKRWLKAQITIVVMTSLIAGFIAVKVLQVLRVIPL